MTPTTARQMGPIPSPSTPSKPPTSPAQQKSNISPTTTLTQTPTPESRMYPPALPRSMIGTPVREREGSIISTSGGSGSRKPRQNIDERDHLCILRHCHEQKHTYKGGAKTQFWAGISTAFQKDTGKVLAQLSATVGRLLEARRRQLNDWEEGTLASKPDGELNDLLDSWKQFVDEHGKDEEKKSPNMKQWTTAEIQKREARRQAMAADSWAASQHPMADLKSVVVPPTAETPVQPAQPESGTQGNEVTPTKINDEDANDFRPLKRRRVSESRPSHPLRLQVPHEINENSLVNSHEPPRRVLIEGAMTKEDWRDVMGNDARLRALETKVDKIELLLTQTNRLILQLVQNQMLKGENRTEEEEDRMRVHLDDEFERDYL